MHRLSLRLLLIHTVLGALFMPQTLLAAGVMPRTSAPAFVTVRLHPVEDAPPVYLPIVDGPPPEATLVTAPADWSAGWWQWNEALDFQPVLELGDIDCSLGQSGEVWFLAAHRPNLTGVPANEAVRRCTIPARKTLLAALYAMNWHNDPGENLTVDEKRAVLDAVFSDQVPGDYLGGTQICRLQALLDGKTVPYQRLKSPPFQHLQDPQTIADGFFVAFQLPPGAHIVIVAGALCAFGTDTPVQTQYIRYEITSH